MKGDYSNFVASEEHDPTYRVKRVSNFVSDGDGNLVRDMADGFMIGAYDTIELTYVPSGNGVGEIETVTYKSGATTLATLTLAYNADNKLTSVTKS